MADEKPWHGEEGSILLLVLGMSVAIGVLVWLVKKGAFSG